MTKQTLLRHIRSISLFERDMPLSLQDAREVAVDNGLMTNSTPKGKLTSKGKTMSFNGHGKANDHLVINYQKLALSEINKLFE